MIISDSLLTTFKVIRKFEEAKAVAKIVLT